MIRLDISENCFLIFFELHTIIALHSINKDDYFSMYRSKYAASYLAPDHLVYIKCEIPTWKVKELN